MKKLLLLCVPMVALVGCSQAPEIEADSSEEQAKAVWQQHIKHTTHYDEALYETVITQYAGTDLAKKARLDALTSLSQSLQKKDEFIKHYEQYKRVYNDANEVLPAELIYADWAMSFYNSKFEKMVNLDTNRDLQLLLDTYHKISSLRKDLPTKADRQEALAKLDEIQSVMEQETLAKIKHERKLGNDDVAESYTKQLKQWFPKTQVLS